MNYFELFGLPESLVVDKILLKKRFFALQRNSHPDYFSLADEAAQDEAEEKTAELNKGFKILNDKDATLEYLLKEKGLVEPNEKYPLPTDFLMEVMELNENLSGANKEPVEAFEKEIYFAVQPLMEHYDNSSISTQDLLRLKEYYYKKKYLQRILDRIDG